MAAYPIEPNDDENLTSAVNYLLSGPSGLGQNFAGFSNSSNGYLIGNYRPPFTQPNNANLYVAPISLSTCEMPDGRTWKYYFATPEPIPPFALGCPLTILGVADDWYDGTYNPIGVIECTTTYVIVRTNSTYAIHAPSTGGTASFSVTRHSYPAIDEGWISTDCNAKVTVTGATDRVFLSAQLNDILTYEATTTDNGITYEVAINRYIGVIDNDPINPDYKFNYDASIAYRTYSFSGLPATGADILTEKETLFISIIDKPLPGYYWYIVEVRFVADDGKDIEVTQSTLSLRSLGAQVVKQ